MTRGIDSSFQTELRSADPKPVILLKIATGLTSAGNDYIRITDFETSLKFPSTTGSTFTARPFAVSDISIGGTEQSAIEITLPDVDFEFDTWFASTDFRLQTVTRYLVERDSLDAATKALTDSFRILSRSRTDRVVTFTAEPILGILSRLTIPRRSLSREDYPGISDRGVIS